MLTSTPSTPINPVTLVGLIEVRQTVLGLTDDELSEALGFDRKIAQVAV